MEQKNIQENSVELCNVEITNSSNEGKEVLDKYVETLRERKHSNIVSCVVCGNTRLPLKKVDKNDRDSKYICKLCSR